jgi:hypothetical protein
MTGQEARDDEREALARVLGGHYYVDRTSGAESHCSCGKWVESVQRRPHVSWGQHLADVALAARKHPEPEITDEMVERAWRNLVGESDFRYYDHEEVRSALEAALRVSVEEEPNRGS